jgi:adenylate kinase family enzyme
MESFPHKRICVVGTTGSGKSTLAEKLARRLDLDYIEIDALDWGPNWTPVPDEVLLRRLDLATQASGWAIAGNYGSGREIVWPRAEAVIWLDYTLPLIFWRLLRRTIRRAVTREELWNGNLEQFWWHLKLWSEESLFHWLFKTYWRRKREYPMLFAQPDYRHLHVLRFCSPRDLDAWFRQLSI